MTIEIRQTSEYAGHDHWKWSVWLDGSATDLKKISHVVYTLHPSFAKPIRRIDTRANGFRLNSSGWGRFEIHIQIVSTTGARRSKRYWLDLEYPATAKAQRPAKELRPVVYVASSATDRAIAQKLSNALTALGLEISAHVENRLDSPSITTINQMIQEAVGLVLVLTGRPTLWLHNELQVANHLKKRIVVVLASEQAFTPSAARGATTINMVYPEEVSTVAKKIADCLLKQHAVVRIKHST